MKVVFDTNVVISAAGWRGASYHCLVFMARRWVMAHATRPTIAEVQEVAKRLEKLGQFPNPPWPILRWYLATVRMVEPPPTGKRRSRDPKDDIILAAALGADASLIVASDKDLLSLGKPFGIEIITPAELVRRMA